MTDTHDVLGEELAITLNVNMVNGTNVFANAGNPNGTVTAARIGDLCIDTTNGRLYQATATDTLHWNVISTTVLSGSQTAPTGGGFAADTYLAGSKIVVPTAGAWRAGAVYSCLFDMTKTGAGTATPVVTVRMGTLGTTGDAAIMAFTFGAGTGVPDTGVFDLNLQFRSVGAATSAVVAGVAELRHQLASTGLTTTGTAGYQAVPVASSGFNSTTQTTIGISFNGGASFSGTNVMCDAALANNV